MQPRAGRTGERLAADPAGALACLTNEPASKRAVIGLGTRLPSAVAVVLARLIDRAAPASLSTARRCAPTTPLLLTRFDYPTGPVDLVESSGCPDGDVAYVHDRGYILPTVLAGYLQGATNPSGGGFTPDVLGEPLRRAGSLVRQTGETMGLAGEVIDTASAGTVVLQYPTLDHTVEVIAAVHRSPRCRARQLAVQYLTGGAGAGNDFGTILIRDSSASWCELAGPVTVTGITAHDAATNTVTVVAAGNLELSPHAVAAVPGRLLPADQLAASVPLSAAYRDDGDGSLCEPHWVVPRTWRVGVGLNTFTVANGQATVDERPLGTGGLITCRGLFGAGQIRITTS